MPFYPLIGISGAARSGKDTLCRALIREFKKINLSAIRKSIAGDTVKKDLQELLMQKLKIDSFTENINEKTLIRPMLVEYGKLMRNTTQGRYFIDNFEYSKNTINIIPDIRYAEYKGDELGWLKDESKGVLIFLEREEISDANETEKINNKIIRNFADHYIKWGRLNEEDEAEKSIINSYAREFLLKKYLPLVDWTVRSL
jgi:hypothetical protein